MAASVILTNLPRDASKALETAGTLAVTKSASALSRFALPYVPTQQQRATQLTRARALTVTVRLQPIGSAPHLNQRVFKLSTNQRFETIVRFLRKRLGAKEHESVFCYVGSVFSPALDEDVGNLWTVSWRGQDSGWGVRLGWANGSQCFKQNEELVVGYAMAPAFG
jgi:ubiquitin-like protein ATG12